MAAEEEYLKDTLGSILQAEIVEAKAAGAEAQAWLWESSFSAGLRTLYLPGSPCTARSSRAIHDDRSFVRRKPRLPSPTENCTLKRKVKDVA